MCVKLINLISQRYTLAFIPPSAPSFPNQPHQTNSSCRVRVSDWLIVGLIAYTCRRLVPTETPRRLITSWAAWARHHQPLTNAPADIYCAAYYLGRTKARLQEYELLDCGPCLSSYHLISDLSFSSVNDQSSPCKDEENMELNGPQ